MKIRMSLAMPVESIRKVLFHPITEMLLWLQFAAAITIFTYYATAPVHIPAGNTDSVLHFVGNFLLFMSARLAFLKFQGHWFVLAFALIYGSAMEASQYFLPARYFDSQDLLANWLGVFAGLSLALIIEFVVKKWIARRSVTGTD